MKKKRLDKNFTVQFKMNLAVESSMHHTTNWRVKYTHNWYVARRYLSLTSYHACAIVPVYQVIHEVFICCRNSHLCSYCGQLKIKINVTRVYPLPSSDSQNRIKNKQTQKRTWNTLKTAFQEYTYCLHQDHIIKKVHEIQLKTAFQ